MKQVVIGNKIDVEESKRMVSARCIPAEGWYADVCTDLFEARHDLLPVERRYSILRDECKGGNQR